MAPYNVSKQINPGQKFVPPLIPGSLRVLLVTAPMTQLNTPYPATSVLKGFLNNQGYSQVVQADLSLELFLRLMSQQGVRTLRAFFKSRDFDFWRGQSSLKWFQNKFTIIEKIIEPVIHFLQGKDPTLAYRIVTREFLPEGQRFEVLDDESLDLAFGAMGVQDRARYLATLFLDDLMDVVRFGVDPKFEMTRYGEKLAASQPYFKVIEQELKNHPTILDQWIQEITLGYLKEFKPHVVGVSAPFPGNIYGAFKIAMQIKESSPETVTILGGGYVNTELRSLRNTLVFDYFDYVTLDDGEGPLLSILEFVQGRRKQEECNRVFFRQQGKVTWISHPTEKEITQKQKPAPSTAGLQLDKYLSLVEMLNPMHRLWSDGRWNKLTLAHGCYWRKCSFCDIHLDYISRYEAQKVDTLVEQIEQIIAQTGQRGFHFVDEAAPPALLKSLAERLIQRNVTITWWGNIRFEKSFTLDTCKLLARSGCVAVSGGLEVASDRILQVMKKGVTVDQVFEVTQAFSGADILVHAYLMYGFPGQTLSETVESLENVRQLFLSGRIQSAFWHRFSVTAHSEIGKNPHHYGVELAAVVDADFAVNDVDFQEVGGGADHEWLGSCLKKATFNYMLGNGLDLQASTWFV